MKVVSGHWSQARSRVLPLRIAVFVDEQRVPIEMEEDEHDAVSFHAWIENASGEVIATGRLLPDGHLGRIAVARSCRGQGYGGAILEHLISAARDRGMAALALHAQTSALPFYEKFGFQPEGEVFMEAGIAHQLMTRQTD